MIGCGMGLVYTNAVVVVCHYFDRYRTFAAGVTVMGAGVGTTVFPAVFWWVYSEFTWQEMIVVFSGIYMQTIVLGALMRPLDAETEEITVNQEECYNKNGIPSQDRKDLSVVVNDCMKEETLLSSLLRGSYVAYSVGIAFVCLGMSVVYLHLSAYAIQAGASEEESATLFLIIGISSVCTRIATGAAGNHEDVDLVTLTMGTVGITALATLTLPLYIHLAWGRFLYALLFGLYGNCCYVLMSPIIVELVSLKALNMAYGFLLLDCGVPYLIGPPIAGVYMLTQYAIVVCFIYTVNCS